MKKQMTSKFSVSNLKSLNLYNEKPSSPCTKVTLSCEYDSTNDAFPATETFCPVVVIT